MSYADAIRSSRATGIGLGALGFFWGGFAALMPDWQARAGVNDGELGLLLLLSAVGGMSAMAAGPRVQAALGAQRLPILGVQLGLVALVTWAVGSALTLGLLLLWLGWSMASLDIAANVEVSHREAATGLSLMNWNHALFSGGFALAAALAGAARRADAGPSMIMAGVGLVVMAAAVAMRERPISGDQAEEGAPKGSVLWAVALPAGAILFCSFVAENATESWSALHLERSFGAPSGAGAAGPMVMGVVMALGRLFGQALAQRLGEARLVALSAAIGAFGAALTAAAPVAWMAVAGIALIGAGAAVVVPSANSLLGRRVGPSQRALTLSRAWMIGFTGFFIGPVVMGSIAEGAGLRWSFAAIALVMAAILPGLWRLARH